MAEPKFDALKNNKQINEGLPPPRVDLKDLFTGVLNKPVMVGALGAGYVLIDAANARIIINDGTYDIILLGFQEGGF